jgi:hypothetical protein
VTSRPKLVWIFLVAFWAFFSLLFAWVHRPNTRTDWLVMLSSSGFVAALSLVRHKVLPVRVDGILDLVSTFFVNLLSYAPIFGWLGYARHMEGDAVRTSHLWVEVIVQSLIMAAVFTTFSWFQGRSKANADPHA